MKINGVIIKPSDKPVLHCGTCGLPYTSAIGAPECDCPPIKLRAEAVAEAEEAPLEVERVPPPSGWRDRPGML